jgi:uncharacterized OB-fold protein
VTGRPLPVPDEQSAAYWQATAAHQLVVARCSRCERFTHPPDIVCPHCHHTDPGFRFEPVSGRGTICSWTTMHQSFVPGFDELLPFVLVDVRLEEDDVRLIGRLIDDSDAPLQVGAAVTVVFEDLAPGTSVPAFARTTA